MSTFSRREIDEDGRLDEQYVQDAFHTFLKSSLAQAKAERLLDVKVLSSAEEDFDDHRCVYSGLVLRSNQNLRLMNPLILTRTALCLFRSITLHTLYHRFYFSPYSTLLWQSRGRVRIVPST